MKHVPAFFFAALAVLFAVLYLTKSPPEAPPQTGIDPREKEIVQLRSDLLKQKMRIAELEIAAAEAGHPGAGVVAAIPNAPEIPHPPAAADLEAATIRALEDQIPGKIGEALAGLFDGLDLTNLVANGSNAVIRVGPDGLGGVWQRQADLEGKQRTEREYGDLLSMFDLSLEDRERFIELLSRRGGGLAAFPGIPPELVPGAGQPSETEAAIEEFLGEEGYKAYREYEDTKYARDKLRNLESVLGAGLEMNPAQKQGMFELFDGMEEFSQEFTRKTSGFGQLAGEAANDSEALLDELEQQYTELATRASEFLDERQTDALSTHLDNRFKQAEAQVEMAGKMREQIGDLGLGGFFSVRPGDGDAPGAPASAIVFGRSLEIDEDAPAPQPAEP